MGNAKKTQILDALTALFRKRLARDMGAMELVPGDILNVCYDFNVLIDETTGKGPLRFIERASEASH
jgi:hypothetical protein